MALQPRLGLAARRRRLSPPRPVQLPQRLLRDVRPRRAHSRHAQRSRPPARSSHRGVESPCQPVCLGLKSPRCDDAWQRDVERKATQYPSYQPTSTPTRSWIWRSLVHSWLGYVKQSPPDPRGRQGQGVLIKDDNHGEAEHLGTRLPSSPSRSTSTYKVFSQFWIFTSS